MTTPPAMRTTMMMSPTALILYHKMHQESIVTLYRPTDNAYTKYYEDISWRRSQRLSFEGHDICVCKQAPV